MTDPAATFPAVTIDGVPLAKEAMAYERQRLLQFYSQHMPQEQLQQQMPSINQKAVDQAIGAYLLMQQANKLDLPVTEDDIDTRLERIQQDVGGPDELTRRLAAQNITEKDFRDNLRQGAKVDALIAKTTAGLPDPTEDQIRAHFDAHRDEYTRAERVLAQHILITPESDTDHAKDTALATIQDLRVQLDNGADFADLAAAHSHCPSGKQSGGSLGWFSRGMMVPEFENAVFNMANDELSQPIQTSFGFHLIKKTDTEAAAPADFDESRESIRDFLRHNIRGEALTAYVNELREKADVQITQ